jgi:hypothetical protein
VKQKRAVWTGRVTELTIDEARESAKLAVLNGLAVVRATLFSNTVRLLCLR